MPALMNMPEVMANAMEATLSTWLKKEGDTVAAGDAIAEVETEKATIEIEAEADGVIARLLVGEGTSVDVGTPILIIQGSGETDAQVASLLESVGTDAGTAAATPGLAVPAETTPAESVETNTPVVEAPGSRERADAPPSVLAPVHTSSDHNGRIFSSPLARRMAQENQLDVSVLTGTGPGGRIIRRDVEQAITAQSRQPQTPAAPGVAMPSSTQQAEPQATPAPPVQQATAAGTSSIPHTKMRRAIARRLTESKSTVPHFYLTADVRMDDLMTLRKQINESSSRKITVNDLVVKAGGLALRDVPQANVVWTDEAQLQFSSADISVAIAVDGGLLTPVVRNVDSSSLSSVSVTIGDFVERAKTGKIRQDELTGGSFSVTNLGMFGTKQFSAILNPPQSAILAVGAAEPRAVVTDGKLAVATMMTCTLSADHRVIDGAVAAQWMNAFKTCMENPLAILI
ncbi:dihydrolipoamide acetyltransferase family protein [Arthrobacter sp. MI7-26]|uniref:dihydrolipoamide acetyltransferase family protein n=1 Tax=Arthrobacter sp. MI7-26 TaxID=2993653 RepID=UPI00224943DC|nr:dihydrolipoamide acetyltransferase family protein [Arthrobacter sp. MI7-26]MCX2748999.1 dihydrolipoamide acetyltransferase family protein [Arthrobacter sp. MI7-26]